MEITREQPATNPIEHDECVRCGYNLHGIANDQACPECGLLAERSRRISDELHESRPKWLARMSRGIWLILVAICLPFASLPINWMLSSYGQQYYYGPRASVPMWLVFLFEWSSFACAVLAALCLFIGALLLASREGYAPADKADSLRRRLLRLWALIPLLAIALELSMEYLWRQSRGWIWPYFARWQSSGVVLLLTLGTCPLPLLLFYQLRSLAKRARSAHLAEHCAIVGIGTSLSLLYIAAVYLVFEFQRELGLSNYWSTKSNASLVLMLILTVSASLFILWSLYLLIRFAISFGKASRLLRAKWLRDDRSLGDAALTAP